jgi:hypothetical protein
MQARLRRGLLGSLRCHSRLDLWATRHSHLFEMWGTHIPYKLKKPPLPFHLLR